MIRLVLLNYLALSSRSFVPLRAFQQNTVGLIRWQPYVAGQARRGVNLRSQGNRNTPLAL
jgi:hypothetical protein